jgi:hypothetical protein
MVGMDIIKASLYRSFGIFNKYFQIIIIILISNEDVLVFCFGLKLVVSHFSILLDIVSSNNYVIQPPKKFIYYLRVCGVFSYICFLLQNLPHDAYKLLAVPSPIGGVLVIGVNTIHYHSEVSSTAARV